MALVLRRVPISAGWLAPSPIENTQHMNRLRFFEMLAREWAKGWSAKRFRPATPNELVASCSPRSSWQKRSSMRILDAQALLIGQLRRQQIAGWLAAP